MLRIAGRVAVLLALANFTAFWFASMALGGDALNGRSTNGHYYVAEHGNYTEVTETQFRYSAWHARSIFATHALGFLGAFVLYAIGDPFVTRRNTRRDHSIVGVMGASMLLGIVGGKSTAWFPFLVFPLAIAVGVLLDLRDASESGPPHEAGTADGKSEGAAQQ